MPSVNRYLRRSSLSRPIPCLLLFSSLCGVYMTMLIAASLSSTLSLAQRHFYIRRVRAENKNEKLIERTIVCSYAGTKHQTRTHEHKQFEGICLFRFREHLEVIVNTVQQFHKLIARQERLRGSNKLLETRRIVQSALRSSTQSQRCSRDILFTMCRTAASRTKQELLVSKPIASRPFAMRWDHFLLPVYNDPSNLTT